MKIDFEVNGKGISAEVAPDLTLLDFLRDQLALTGAKRGCLAGECGACTVLVDSVPTLSCHTRMREMQNRRVLTIEGLAPGTPCLHPVQQAFIDMQAVQCGFCTPGMVMRVKALLDRYPEPKDEEIRTFLEPNLCRCTGYLAIIRAVQRASLLLKGTATLIELGRGLGASYPDREIREKVTGSLQFAADMTMEDMLHGKILLSAHPHAEIIALDVSPALKVPGVKTVLTHVDVPGPNRFGRAIKDQPVLAVERVRFLGDPIAVVFAETPRAALQGCRAIRVEYRILPGVFDPNYALSEGAPRLHEGGNLLKSFQLQRGDARRAFETSDVVIEDTYATSCVEHAYMETEAGLARLSPDGGITIWYPTQVPFLSRKQVADNLQIPEEKIRIITPPLGGGFGGKNDVTLEILLALGAAKTGRPVKISLDRRESLLMSTKRHPFRMRYRTGATSLGELTAIEADLIADAGPYAAVSTWVLEQAVIFSGGPYFWPAVNVRGRAAYTNNALGGAFRGYGINQVNFAVETQMDRMARALSMDPVEFRMRNALEAGKKTITGEVLKESVAIKETLRRVASALEKEQQSPPPPAGKKRGFGIACGYKNVGAGRGGKEHAGAVLTLTPEGRILVRATAVDMGQGIRTVLCQIAAEAIGADFQAFEIVTGDTDRMPEGIGASAQRQTYISGNAVLKASCAMKEKILAAAGEYLGEGPCEVRGNEVTRGKGRITLKDLAHRLGAQGRVLESSATHVVEPTFSVNAEGAESLQDYRNYPAYNYMTQAAVVEVDESGDLRVVKLIAAHDVGRALNPGAIRGQLEGGLVMGLGYALSERYPVEEGRPVLMTLRGMGLPTFGMVPQLEICTIEDPEPSGPFGAKGISEAALLPTAAAIMNAIYDATGVRLTSLPLRPLTKKERRT